LLQLENTWQEARKVPWMQKFLFIYLSLILFMADSESVSTAYQRYSLNLPKKEKNENFVKKDKHQKNPQNLKKEYVNYQPIPKQL